jgi:hypothetical protein
VRSKKSRLGGTLLIAVLGHGRGYVLARTFSPRRGRERGLA